LFTYNTSRSNPQCVSSSFCAFPKTKIQNSTFDDYYDCEVTCDIAAGSSTLFIDRASQQCEESCLYQNETTIDGISYHVCEAANTSTCPYLKRKDNTDFTCMDSCDSTNKFNLSGLCVSTCLNESRTFVSLDGTNCVSSCSFGYSIINSEAQCVPSCGWPSAFYVDTNYDSSEKRCSTTCPSGTFLSRSDQDCISSCGYRNATLVNGNAVCEAPGNSTFCPFLEYAQTSDTFLTCVSECEEAELQFTNSSFIQCVSSCPNEA